MTKRTTWTPDDDRKLRKMNRDGLTQIQMGAALGRSARGIGDRLSKLGIPAKRQRPAPRDYAAITEPAMSPFDRMIEYGSKRLLARLIERGYWRESA